MRALGNIMMQLIEKRSRGNGLVSASDLPRWSPTVINFLSNTTSASAQELALVSWKSLLMMTSLTSKACVPQGWVAERRPPLVNITHSTFLTQVLQRWVVICLNGYHGVHQRVMGKETWYHNLNLVTVDQVHIILCYGWVSDHARLVLSFYVAFEHVLILDGCASCQCSW